MGETTDAIALFECISQSVRLPQRYPRNHIQAGRLTSRLCRLAFSYTVYCLGDNTGEGKTRGGRDGVPKILPFAQIDHFVILLAATS